MTQNLRNAFWNRSFLSVILLGLALLLLTSSPRTAHSDEEGGMEVEANVTEGDSRAPASFGDDYRTSAEPLSDKITKATVYSDRATVTREAAPLLSAGKRWVEFARLPQSLDRSSIRAEVKSPGQLVQVVMEEVFEHVGLAPEIQRKVGELRELYARLLVLTQEQSSLQDQLRFVKSLSFEEPFRREPAAQVNRSFRANVPSLKGSLEEIKTQSDQLTQQSSKLQTQIGTLNESIDLLVRELETVTSVSDQKWVLHAYVLVDNPTKGKVPVELSYSIPNAKWYPSYDLRAELNRESGTADIKLVTSALVNQETGEDWKATELTFSSLDPVPLFLPRLTRWTFEEHRTEAVMALKETVADAPARSQLAQKPSPKSDYSRSKRAARKDRNEDFGRRMGKMADPSGGGAGAAAPMAAPQVAAPADLVASEPVKNEEDDSALRDNKRSGLRKGQVGPVSYNLVKLEDKFPVLAKLGSQMKSFAEKRQFRPVDLSAARAEVGQIKHSDPNLPAVQAKGRLVELKSPFHMDVDSSHPVKTPLDTLETKGILSYYSVPKLDDRVFLRAKMVNQTPRLLIAGDAQIFMDGDLVTKNKLPTIDEGGTFVMDLGVDKNIQTKRVVTKHAENKGLVSSSRVTDVEVKIELANHHNFPVKMEVKDNYPLSPEDRLKIDLQKVSPEPAEKKDGLITWQVNVPANDKRTLTFHYQVQHPKNSIVSEFN